jgi:uncharacterized repeat protein (TIGR03833 family)
MSAKRDGQHRSSVRVGSTVEVIRKEDQGTGRRTRGIVAEILTNSSSHPHGIKVRLRDGTVGRVATIIDDDRASPNAGHASAAQAGSRAR